MSNPTRTAPERSSMDGHASDRVAVILAEVRALVARLEPRDREFVMTSLERDLAESAAPMRRGTFGMLKGRFEVGPEFFEPLPEEELRAWGEI